MRKLLVGFVAILPAVAACTDDDGGPTPYDGEDIPLSGEADVKGDFPGNDALEPEGKADATYPRQWNELKNLQSPVKSQGSRGVCSIFATTAQVEHLYLKAGMANPDFSEQYLQWSVKREVGDFANTEGSSGSSNLEAVVDYGVVKESDWPYESAPWSSANDPACNGGENLPTKCYTNGEPPASARSATKYKVPSRRWLNSTTSSIKAHLTSKKTGVVVGMTFFYQSWNHRRSALPVNSDYWRKGYVTFPNSEDQAKSREQAAGHAILIIGWDDDLEVPMRDKDGKQILDSAGKPRMEKGFFLFKNSWGTEGFGVEHPNGPGYGWLSYNYVASYGSAVVGEVPTLQAAPEAACDDGRDNDSDGRIDCADSDCTGHAECSSSGAVHTFDARPNASIPDNSPAGLSNVIRVPTTGTVGSVKVTVAIDHTYRGDLTVTLSHSTATKVLIAEEGGSADDLRQTFDIGTYFAGTSLAGDWTLKVTDSAAQDTGTLESWSLEIATN